MKNSRNKVLIACVSGFCAGLLVYGTHKIQINYYKRQTIRSVEELHQREIALGKWNKGLELNEQDTRILMSLMDLDYKDPKDKKSFIELEGKRETINKR